MKSATTKRASIRSHTYLLLAFSCAALLALGQTRPSDDSKSQVRANEKLQGVATIVSTWTGLAGNGLWSDPGNWDTPDFPNNISGVTVYDVILVGDVTLDIEIIIQNFSLDGSITAIAKGVDLTVEGDFDFLGSMSGPGTTWVEGNLDLPGIEHIIDGRTLLIDEFAEWLQGDIVLDNGAILEVSRFGTLRFDAVDSGESIRTNTSGNSGRVIVSGLLTNGASSIAKKIRVPLEVTDRGEMNLSSQLVLLENTVFSGDLHLDAVILTGFGQSVHLVH